MLPQLGRRWHSDAIRLRTCSARHRCPSSGVERLPVRTPLLPVVLDDLARLLVADLDQFVLEIAPLPFDDQRRKFPAKILPQSLIGGAVVVLKSTDEPIRVVIVRSSPMIAKYVIYSASRTLPSYCRECRWRHRGPVSTRTPRAGTRATHGVRPVRRRVAHLS